MRLPSYVTKIILSEAALLPGNRFLWYGEHLSGKEKTLVIGRRYILRYSYLRNVLAYAADMPRLRAALGAKIAVVYSDISWVWSVRSAIGCWKYLLSFEHGSPK